MSQPTTSKESGNHHTLVSQNIVDGEISVITSSQSPLRVFLLGPFAIEQANGILLNLDTLLGRSQSSILFKLLLCHPERCIIRERLIDTLWPGQSYSAMESSLGVAKSILKTRLETVCGQPIMPRVSGDPPVYSLAGQTIIWTDIDACEQFIRQALNTKSAQNALPLWEAAYALLQHGTLLSNDQNAYWYQSNLVQNRRKRLVRQRTQCILRIADLALECKSFDRAIAVLNEESEADPANEEIALHLMEFLARYGRHNEALQCYARLEAALLEQDTEPRSATRALAQQLRSIATTKVSLERHALLIPLQAESQIMGEPKISEIASDSELQLPQQAPPFWTVPYPRNPFFTGRQELLIHIHDQLHQIPAVAVTQAQAICGLGGIGKTQTALEYAYRYRQEYQAIFWVKADTQENLLAGFLAIASLLHLPAQSAGDHAVTAAAVKHWFQCHEQWLLILDNADDLALVREFLPSGHQGHVLLTTRMQAVGGLAYSVQVEEMDQEVGAIFLLRRAGLLPPDTSILDKTTADCRLAQEFVREVGGLPLALDQAGAYIEETASSLQEYLGLYHTHRLALLQRRGGLTIDHSESVATTWAVAFTHLENNDPVAADLLRLCAFLDPDAIPEEILIEGTEAVPLDQLRMNEALAVLMRFSLIRRNIQTRTLTIHRLVQAVIQDTMDKDTQRNWAEKAASAVKSVFPKSSNVYSTLGYPYRAIQVLKTSIHVDQEHGNKQNLATALWNLAVQQQVLGKLATSEQSLQECITICQNIQDVFSEAKAHQYLALLRAYQGEFAEATQHLDIALFLFNQTSSAVSESAVWAYRALCALLTKNTLYAIEAARKALELAGTGHPERDIIRAEWLLGWGYCCLAIENREHDAENLCEAEKHLQDALNLCQRTQTVDYEADLLLAWARLYYAKKDTIQAKQCAERALAIANRSDFRVLRADILNFLAHLALASGRHQEASDLAQAAFRDALCDGFPYSYKSASNEAKRLLDEIEEVLKR